MQIEIADIAHEIYNYFFLLIRLIRNTFVIIDKNN